MTYTCPHAVKRRGEALFYCDKAGKQCGNQRYCPKKQVAVLTEFSLSCPLRSAESKTEAEKPKPKPKKKQTAAKKKKEDK